MTFNFYLFYITSLLLHCLFGHFQKLLIVFCKFLLFCDIVVKKSVPGLTYPYFKAQKIIKCLPSCLVFFLLMITTLYSRLLENEVIRIPRFSELYLSPCIFSDKPFIYSNAHLLELSVIRTDFSIPQQKKILL